MARLIIHIVVCLFIVSSALVSQDYMLDNRLDKRFGVSAVIGGQNGVGFSIDYFIIPQLNAEFTATPFGDDISGFGGGLKYFFNRAENSKLEWFPQKKGRKWFPYIGLYASSMQIRWIWTRDKYKMIYVPVGIQYMAYSGFSFSIDAGYFYHKDRRSETKEELPWFSVKTGFRF